MMRLLALDIDHTLTGSTHRITEPNARAVAKAIERGVSVTLITGRRYAYGASGYAGTLDLSGLLGCHYGRRLIEHPSGAIVASHPLPEGAARTLVDAARCSKDAVISIFVEDLLLFDRMPPDLVSADLPQFTQGDLDAVIAREPEKIISVHVSCPQGAPDVVRAVAERCGPLFPGLLDFYFSPWSGNPAGLVTAISSAADKGTALLEIARRYGHDPAETVAMGDSVADIPMLRAAGVGVAMPWADEEVRAAADLVAEGGPDEAVALAIEALLD